MKISNQFIFNARIKTVHGSAGKPCLDGLGKVCKIISHEIKEHIL